MANVRQQRKLDHVRLAVEGSHGQRSHGLATPGWEEIRLVHQSLPELSLEQIDLSTTLGRMPLDAPILINAMTGGASGVTGINRDLATAAAQFGLAMAVGSQTAGLRDREAEASYRVVREVNPDGLVLANLSAEASLDQAREAVAMVGANLLQIHLNAPQELVMAEGDRDFRGMLTNISRLVESLEVPVVVKECGFGLSRETVRLLYDVGVRTVDLSGRGGTNFLWIEAARSGEELDPGLQSWGNPTPVCLAESAALELSDLELIASGGISFGSEVVKALALGASAVGLAGAVLRVQQEGGAAGVGEYLEKMLLDIRRMMLLCGAQSVRDLWHKPVIMTGVVAEWSGLRGVNLQRLANRN